GTAGVDFDYFGIYGGDGRGGYAGNLYLIDPRNGASVAIGAIHAGSGDGLVNYGVTGMAFSAGGTLYATQSPHGTEGENANLLTIDPATAEVTVVGELTDSVDPGTNHGSVASIAFSGDTLVGWTEEGDDVCTIDTDTGVTTVVADSENGSAGDGMVTLL